MNPETSVEIPNPQAKLKTPKSLRDQGLRLQWLFRGYGKEMEPTVVYWGYIEIMEKRMEATIQGLCLPRPTKYMY